MTESLYTYWVGGRKPTRSAPRATGLSLLYIYSVFTNRNALENSFHKSKSTPKQQAGATATKATASGFSSPYNYFPRKKHSTASAFFVTGLRPDVIETPLRGVIGLLVAKNFEKI